MRFKTIFSWRSRALSPRVNPRRDFMSPVGASIYCSPHHRLRSRLTRRPAMGICRLGFRVGELYHGEDMVNIPPLMCYKYGVAFITLLNHIIPAVRLNDKILKRLRRAGTNRVFTRSDFL